jgi:antitoxin component YwqK of YwqJK toxin-antitoxin module
MIPRFLAGFILLLAFSSFSVHAQQIGDAYKFGKEYIIDGIREYDRVNYEDAIELFKKVQPGDSLYALARYELALAQHADSLNTEALQNVDWVIANDRSSLLDALVLKATILDHMGREKESIEVLDFAAKEFGQSHRPFYERAVVKADIKDFKGALADCAESLSRNYLHARTHMLIAVLANDAERSALASMASGFAAQTVNGDPNYLNYAVGFLEGIANKANKQKFKDIPAETFAFCDHLAYIDEIVYSKTALSKNYKSKVKGDYNLSKQLQVISESLAKESAGDDVILRFYVNYYQQVWNKKHFEGMVASILASIDNVNTQNVAKKYKSKINLFSNDVLAIIHTGRTTVKCTNNGRTLEGFTYASGGQVLVLGDLSKDLNIEGQAYYFHKNGILSAEGKAYGEDKKEGQWKYYYNDGTLRKIEEYEDGQLNGTKTSFAETGAMQEKAEVKNGKNNGRIITYNEDGSKQTEYVVDGEGVIQDSLLQYNDHNVLKYALIYKGMNKSDRICFYNPNGTVSYECQLINDKINDEVEVKNNDGKVTAKGKIVDGDKEGEWQYFYEDGKLKEVGNYKSGKQEGEWKSYHENDKISAVELYKGGKLNGMSTLYDLDGNKKAEILYKNGKNLDYKVFDAAGKVIDEMKSEGGTMYVKVYNDLRKVVREGKVTKEKSEGLWKYYHSNGVIKLECNYKNDLREGLATEYHNNGVKFREVNYTNDELQGFYREFDEAGNLTEEGYYNEGVFDGPMKVYYPNGKMDSYSFYNKGVLNGELMDYDFDGQLMAITEYRYGVRIKSTSFLANGEQKVEHTPGGNGKIEVYSMSGFKRYEGTLMQNAWSNITREYEADGTVVSELEWKNGQRHGQFKRFLNGTLVEEGKYAYGQRQGDWNYFENGKLNFKVQYKDGDRHGDWESYYESGKLEQTRQYRFDERHGATVYYDENGKAYFKINFFDGAMVSYAIVGADGQFKAEVPIENNSLELVVKFANGAKAREFKYVNGVYEGALKCYYSNGKNFIEANYTKGNENGLSKRYYPSGTLKSEIENKDDREHGSYKFYHENGKLHIDATKFHNTFHGPYKEYDKSGKLIREGVMEMGKFISKPSAPENKPEVKPEPKPAAKAGAKK